MTGDDVLDTGAALRTAADIQAWLVARVAAAQGLDPGAVDAAERLARYGVDSRGAVALVAELARALGRPLAPTLVWEHPTIDALARHLTAPDAPPATAVRAEAARAGEPVAIVGLACRFPRAPDAEAFWAMLRAGADATSEVPPDRWDAGAWYDADPTAPGKAVARRGAFLDGVDRFDPLFFNISPREAEELDPQQRLALELAWEALEDAGVPAHALAGSRTGVFFGSMWHDWADLTAAAPDGMSAHRATGQSNNLIANRVSYALGLRGPSVLVDTACSSALVAIHLACQSLWYGDATLALAGGVNVILDPTSMVFVTKFGGLARDGRCKAFDARGDGFGRGEGGGVVVLKRLARALADGDRVHAVVRGSAVNNDGASHGLTAPNPRAQEEVLALAYRRADLPPSSVHYVEAHGTGTPLGDPIEAGALGRVLGAGRDASRPLVVGSVKTNIAHTEGAAGVAGVVKTVLAMRHRELPPNLHFERPSPHIPFDDLKLRVPTAVEPWPAPDDAPSLAGVSAFGWGGTNAHVVLDGGAPEPRWLALSADAPEALAHAARDLRERAAHAALDAVVREAARRPTSLPCRLALTARTGAELVAALDAFLRGEARPGVAAGCAPARDHRRRVVFVCSPLGSQWVGMAQRLLAGAAPFRAALARCDAALAPAIGWSVLDELAGAHPADRYDDVVLVQPLLFAVQVALAAQWRAWGVEPAAVVGHSAGEIAAAHIAGALSLADAARVVHAYSAAQRPAADRGAMAVVDRAPSEIEGALADLLAETGGRVVVAGRNTRASTVLSGDRAPVQAIVARLKAEGVSCALIRSNVAGHSPHMAPLLGGLEAALAGLRPRPADVPFWSTVTGAALDGRALDGAYFAKNLGQPVRLADALEGLRAAGHDLFVELGPHPVLGYALAQEGALALPSMRRGEDERVTLLDARGRLYALGAAPAEPAPRDELLVLSAKSPAALAALARATGQWLAARPEVPLADACFTAAVRRSHHEHRAAVVGRSREALAEALAALAGGHPPPPSTDVVADAAAGGAEPRVVFVFPGQGSQWVGMGRQLYATEPAFRDALDACERAMAPFVPWSLVAELHADEARSRLGENDVVQPVLWALQVALAALWRSFGVEPTAVVGHSMGEVAAAHVAGALSLGDAARVITLRSQLARRHASGKGAMAVVELGLDDAERAIAGFEDRLAVGVRNGPRTSVLSGDAAALAAVLDALGARGVFCRQVKVDYASHSPQMDPLSPLLLDALAGIAPRAARVPFYSTVRGQWTDGEALDAGYWAENLRAPVRFWQAVQGLHAAGRDAFLEVSAHPVLLPSLEDGLRQLGAGVALPSLRRGEDERACLLRSLARLWVRGASPDLGALFRDGGRVASLPAYPWQRERYARDRSTTNHRPRRAAASRGLLPGDVATSPAARGVRWWEGALAPEDHPWLGDHRVRGAVVWPGAATLAMALEAARAAWGDAPVALADVAFHEALVLAPGEARTVQAVLAERAREPASFRLYSLAPGADRAEESAWTLHASATLHRDAPSRSPESPTEVAARLGGRERTREDFYAALDAWGLDYGPAFRGVTRVLASGDEALGALDLPAALHPAALDAALHVLLAPLALVAVPADGAPMVPARVGRVQVHAWSEGAAWSHATLRAGKAGDAAVEGDVVLLDASGRVLVEVQGLGLRRLRSAPGDDALLSLDWERADVPRAAADRGGRWLLAADTGGLADAVRARLEARGAAVTVAPPGALGEHLRGGTPWRAVVHLASVDLDARDVPLTRDALDDALDRGCASALDAVQALARARGRDVPRLVLVTRGAQAVGDAPLVPLQATLWGLGQTLLYEHPELRCARVDLAPDTPPDALVDELLAESPEDAVALRPDGRYVARLARRGPASAGGVTLDPEGTYLVTGGLGGLGLALARWLVERGARRLVLVGRAGAATPAQREAVAALTASGAAVRVAALDVARGDEVARLLDDVRAGGGSLRGVFHAAGVLDDALATHQDRARLRSVMGPKVRGAWNLHALTLADPLAHFVLYGSAAALVGSPGQSNYAAANAFLDALAHHRRARGLPALAVAWGHFADVGLAARADDRGARLAQRGMRALTTDEGLAALDRLMASGAAHAGVVPLDARQWVEFYPALAASPLFSALARAAKRPTEGGAADLKGAVAAAPPEARATVMEKLLQEQVTRVLRVDASRVHRGSNLVNLGLDSLLGLELRNRLEAGLGLKLASTLAWTYPRIDDLAAHLVDLLGFASPDVPTDLPTDVAPGAPEDADALRGLSDEDLMAALAAELDASGADEN